MNDQTRHEGRSTMRGNGSHPDEIEQDLARTRAEMDETLRAIEHKLSPGEMLDQFMGYWRSGPNEYARNLGYDIRDNPLPVTLVGIGLAWLMYSGHDHERHSADWVHQFGEESAQEGVGASERMHEMKEGMSAKSAELRARSGRRSAEIRERIGSTMDSLRERKAAAGESLHRKRESMGQSAQHGSEMGSNTWHWLTREQPMVLGALAIALGAALGGAMPTTRKERETLGPVGEKLAAKAKETGEELKEQTSTSAKPFHKEGSAPPPGGVH